MKTRIFKHPFLAALSCFALAGTLVLSACDKEDDDDHMGSQKKYSISGTANGDQEVPPVTTTATGSLTGTYDAKTKELIYTISWTGLSGDVTAAHFHGPATVGVDASPMQDLNVVNSGMDGTATDTITASADLHTALLDGKVYYNIHTAANPDGEIRGQVNLSQ